MNLKTADLSLFLKLTESYKVYILVTLYLKKCVDDIVFIGDCDSEVKKMCGTSM